MMNGNAARDRQSAIPDPASPTWRLDEPEPTDLIALWPSDQPPTLAEIRSIIEQFTGGAAEIVGELDADHGNTVHWSAVIAVPGFEQPVIFWVESAESIPVEERRRLGAGQARWAIGVESVLDCNDPLASYVSLMRLVAGSMESSPAILEVNTTRWFTRTELNDYFLDGDIEPPAEILWIIHAVAKDDGSSVWLHTHGLARCGRPEFEMLEVPQQQSGSAAQLINCVAENCLESDLPAPGEKFLLGPGIGMVLQPWREVVQFLDRTTPGSMADRTGDDGKIDPAHGGVRAVICSPKLRGVFRKIWTWPREVVERLERDQAVIARTKRATERQANIARATWPELATAFEMLQSGQRVDHRDDQPVFLIKAAINIDPGDQEIEGEDEGREHLWFRVTEFQGDRAKGELINDPIYIRSHRKGDLLWLDRISISDWKVMSSLGAFEPIQRRALLRAVRELSGRA